MRLALCPTVRTQDRDCSTSLLVFNFLCSFILLSLPLDCHFVPRFFYFVRTKRAVLHFPLGQWDQNSASLFPSVSSDSDIQAKISCDGCCHREKKTVKLCFWPRKKYRGHLPFPLQLPCQGVFKHWFAWLWCRGAHYFSR